MNTPIDYRTIAPRPYCVDCGAPLIDVPSRFLNAEGELVCLRCVQQRDLADVEATERRRQRREAMATVVQLASIILPLALAVAVRTWLSVSIAFGLFVAGRVVAEVLAPRAFRFWISG